MLREIGGPLQGKPDSEHHGADDGQYDDRDEQQVQNTLLAAEEVLKYCIDIGGTLTGEHGVGVEKIHLMPYQFDGPTMRQFQRVKDAFDPEERINAGKLIPSDKINVELIKPGRHVPQ